VPFLNSTTGVRWFRREQSLNADPILESLFRGPDPGAANKREPVPAFIVSNPCPGKGKYV